MTPTLSTPPSTPRKAASSSPAVRTWVSTAVLERSSVAPARVRWSLRPRRSKSGWPASRSSCALWLDTAGGARDARQRERAFCRGRRVARRSRGHPRLHRARAPAPAFLLRHGNAGRPRDGAARRGRQLSRGARAVALPLNRICIVGAGGIGGFLAARLAHTAASITLVAPWARVRPC